MEPLFEELAKLQGQLLALQVALRGLIAASSDPDQVVAAVRASLEAYAAAGLSSTVPDALLDGFDLTTRVLLGSDGASPYRR